MPSAFGLMAFVPWESRRCKVGLLRTQFRYDQGRMVGTLVAGMVNLGWNQKKKRLKHQRQRRRRASAKLSSSQLRR